MSAKNTILNAPEWFDLNNYADSNLLDFEAWRIQIGNRIALQGFIDAGEIDQFNLHFNEIRNSPFFDIGFSTNYPSNLAVHSLTYGVAHTIVKTLEPLSLSPRDSCDQKLSDNAQDSFAMHAHLTVDLNASKSKINEDFIVWLNQVLAVNRTTYPREREAGITQHVIDSWNHYQILPYQDLLLWFTSNAQTKPSDTEMANWLFPEGNGDKDKVRETGNKAKQAFMLSIIRQLSVASE